jgi:hypothetical protein
MCEKACPCTSSTTKEEFLEELLRGMDESWDQDAAGEAIVLGYVRELERRVVALGGSLERWPSEAGA